MKRKFGVWVATVLSVLMSYTTVLARDSDSDSDSSDSDSWVGGGGGGGTPELDGPGMLSLIIAGLLLTLAVARARK